VKGLGIVIIAVSSDLKDPAGKIVPESSAILTPGDLVPPMLPPAEPS